jgi:ring-1,2-phenylacetyl-CoA epoxidase subunit PaaD
MVALMNASQTIPLQTIELYEREQRRRHSPVPELWTALDTVMDPEIPVISIWELGILQDVQLREKTAVVTITPTYSGCPAMQTIAEDIESALAGCGCTECEIQTQLAPAWSSTWIAAEAAEKLRQYGIAPPHASEEHLLQCPHCGSEQVQVISEFGSTACKALYRCTDCAEPFDHFKTF